MRWFEMLRMKCRMLLDRGHEGQRLDDELRFHLEQQIAENIASGMSEEEAHYAALRAFGNPAVLRETTRATWGWGWAETILRDLRIALRSLLRTPGFSALVIAVMALGIGANVAFLPNGRNRTTPSPI